MIVSKHVREGKLVMTIIDDELAGTKWEEGSMQLDFTSNFYRGTLQEENAVRPELKKASIIHAAGKKSMAFLEVEGYNIVENAKRISGIPFINIVHE